LGGTTCSREVYFPNLTHPDFLLPGVKPPVFKPVQDIYNSPAKPSCKKITVKRPVYLPFQKISALKLAPIKDLIYFSN
jgi:hypothetical protein